MPYETFCSISIAVMLLVLNTGTSHFISQAAIHICSKLKRTNPVKTKKYYTESMRKGISYIQYKEGRVDNSLQAWPGPWGSHFSRQSANECGKLVSPTRQTPLPLRKYSGNSFLLEAESIPRPYCGKKDYVNKYCIDVTGNRNQSLPACSALTQLTAPRRDPISVIIKVMFLSTIYTSLLRT